MLWSRTAVCVCMNASERASVYLSCTIERNTRYTRVRVLGLGPGPRNAAMMAVCRCSIDLLIQNHPTSTCGGRARTLAHNICE